MGRSWSKKAQCSSREVIAEGRHRSSVILPEEDLARCCLSRRIWTAVIERAGSSLSMATMYILQRVYIGNWSVLGYV